MKEIEEKAIHSFYNGMNCAQSVLTAYAEHLNFDPGFALSIASGFGGGMGKLQKTCGAVTGSFMALGIYNSQKHFENIEARNATNEMIQKFSVDFKALHGSLDCKALLDCDFKTEEGENRFKDMDLKKNVCSTCISDSIKMVESLIGEK
ncbi:C_GCAxxG_C_C family probable redox protein [Ancylomarina subtilis]|uniref:C_GCAxxG_C_C family probable redox protein n=1 Tax=Ancylomarina subtilis TaxID=1639035 RepID=A0A4Q7VJL1_9BACT|nr:C-GCAxxG-C-C family protein [Ancylomarina subtilis]RZT96247.1 C_GCAxxG_C_C family probable redox protein [Ancylomarina subtilis]